MSNRITRLVAGVALAALVSAPLLAQQNVAPGGDPKQNVGPGGQDLQAPKDPFGESIVLTAKPIIYLKGESTWDEGFDNLVEAFKTLNDFVAKQGLKAAGPVITIYTSSDDSGFDYQAAVPLEEAPKNLPPGDILMGQSPSGKALKFVHRGAYDTMEATYEAITNHLDEKKLEAQDVFIEEYVTDPVSAPRDKLVINVLVPIKTP